MISEKLQLARTYEKDNIKKVPETDRPLYHVTGAVGWINDPNGFEKYKGQYHLFYQYHPYSTHWGPMHWGHVKTKDFIKWDRLPAALAPDKDYDENGCFSGSSIELPDGRQLLIYTGVSRIKDDKGQEADCQQQCIAIGDGIDYSKFEQNPVISSDMLPEECSRIDFRDPKIWEDNGIYYLVVGNRPADGSGQVLLFTSDDALDWKYAGIVDKSDNKIGKMWECPDYFKLGDKYVLAISPQEMRGQGMEFHPGNGTVFVIGEAENWLDFKREKTQAIDYGLDFYAPQSLLTDDGRRVMIAWMQNWDNVNYPNDEHEYFGQMTLPRVLELKDGRVVQNPVEELKNYYGKQVAYENVIVNKATELPEISGRVLDMTIEIEAADAQGFDSFEIKLALDDENETVISYDTRRKVVKLDRSNSGGRHDIVNAREFLVEPLDGKVKFRLLLDRYSVELFVNDGRQAASMTIPTSLSATGIAFDAAGAVKMNLVKFDLEEKL